jgi:gliding motility-associated protein GldL
MSIKYRSTHAPTFQDIFYTKYAPIITGLGASVAILGALFKIMHWPGAAFFLIVGLGAEAMLFGLFAFAPQPSDPDWTIVHPELGYEEHEGHIGEAEKGTGKNLTRSLDSMLENAGLNQESINKLSGSFTKLSENVSNLGDIQNASIATNEYAASVKSASKQINDLNKSYSTTIEAMSELSKASADAREYHSQVQSITKNLGALNAVYEMELQDANNHLKAMNKFYGNLSSAMEAMADASKDTNQFKTELSKLTGNLTTLNSVYGNMLAAMKG